MGRSRLFKLPDLVAGWLRIGSVSPQRAHISQPMPIRRSVGERGRGVVARQADHAVRIAAASRSPIRQDPSGAQRLAAQAAIPPSPGEIEASGVKLVMQAPRLSVLQARD